MEYSKREFVELRTHNNIKQNYWRYYFDNCIVGFYGFTPEEAFEHYQKWMTT